MKKSRPEQSQIIYNNAHSASFRDPSGFIFRGKDGLIYRQINNLAADDYKKLVKSGLYDELVARGMMVKHQEISDVPLLGEAYKIIRPEQIKFISYPFEWSFSQLKDAALLTLSIQKLALSKGMNLKDASAYNIQFHKGKPIMIDTLSFEKYLEGKPWDGYRQFCQHFLAPLALMAYTDIALGDLSRIYIDGIPLDLAAKLLPLKSKAKPSIIMHILLHARAQNAKASDANRPSSKVPKNNLIAIIDNLYGAVNKLHLPKTKTEWGDYYDNTNYTVEAANKKAELILELLKKHNAVNVLDLGGNNGRFSRILNEIGIYSICADIDPNAVENNYQQVKANNESLMLPLKIDLTNPGGGLGWANQERNTIDQRLNTDVTLALALIHHLAISNNLPFVKIAEYFAKFSPLLVIEFVPKQDSQVKRLLATRKDIFGSYDEVNFKKAFALHYNLLKEQKIEGSHRTLYLFERK